MEATKDVKGFKENAGAFMENYSINLLRIYGRREGLRDATRMNKDKLISETIAVICGEKQPDRTRRGAPRKNEFIPLDFLESMEQLKRKYLFGEEPKIAQPDCEKEADERPFYTITVNDEQGRQVACFGTRLDFQIIISNQQTITSAETCGVSLTRVEPDKV